MRIIHFSNNYLAIGCADPIMLSVIKFTFRNLLDHALNLFDECFFFFLIFLVFLWDCQFTDHYPINFILAWYTHPWQEEARWVVKTIQIDETEEERLIFGRIYGMFFSLLCFLFPCFVLGAKARLSAGSETFRYLLKQKDLVSIFHHNSRLSFTIWAVETKANGFRMSGFFQ